MELGLSTSMLGRHALPDRLAILAAHDVPWVEIHGYAREEFDYFDWDLVQATGTALDRHGLRLWSCHSPAGRPLDVAAADEEVRRHTQDIVRQTMQVAADLGARVVVCDAVRRVSRDPEERWPRQALLAESLQRLLEDAARLNIRLVIENHQWWSLFEMPEDFHDLIATHPLPGLGACWDTGHGWLAGHQAETACRLGEHLVTVHLHDNDGREDLHLVPTEGRLTWEPLVPGLRRMGYQGPFMMELAPPNEPTDEAVERLAGRAIEVYRLLVKGDVT